MIQKIVYGLLAIIIVVLAGYLYFNRRPEIVPAPVPAVMSEAQARVIAEQSCIKGGGALASGGTFNENSKTWWFDANLNATQPGCNPACVVSAETETAEINWRCTGLIPDEEKPASTINSFEECVAAGNPVMESYPRQCNANGQTFAEENASQDFQACTDDQRAGDVCAEVYAPVCARVEVECVTAPCEPVMQTFPNQCEACHNPRVNSYYAGECFKETDSGKTDESADIEGITELFRQSYPRYSSKLSIKITSRSENFVRGSLIFDQGAPGGIFLASKAGGNWKIAHAGNGEIPCSLAKEGFPESMLTDCAK